MDHDRGSHLGIQIHCRVGIKIITCFRLMQVVPLLKVTKCGV